MYVSDRFLLYLSKTGHKVQPPGSLPETRPLYKNLVLFLIFSLFIGCAGAPKKLQIQGADRTYPTGTIIQTESGQPVAFNEMMADLEAAKIIYVGEQHTNPEHHEIQVRILKRLSEFHPDLSVGMEMFAHTYQPVLSQWTEGALSEAQLREKTHWYANWKFDFALYQNLLEFIKQERIPLIGLNVPFHIPPKIAVGGIDNLSPCEKAHLPDTIDTADEKHREYVQSVFKQHHKPGLDNFDYFYEAQCVWEDAMAETIVNRLDNRPMLVFAGSGHLRHYYGIPLRAHKRKPVEYRTVLPISAGQTIEADISDYIWVTPEPEKPRHRMPLKN